jgi:hypothetical protein
MSNNPKIEHEYHAGKDELKMGPRIRAEKQKDARRDYEGALR